MSREIKFRAWLNKLDVMLPPKEICYIAFTEGNGVIVHGFAEPIRDVYEDVVLMQSTGLQDKHGKDIYEGDVVLYSYAMAGGITCNSRNEIKWNNQYARFDGYSNGCKVIGTIHENPELLK